MRPRFEIVGDLWGTVDVHARLTLRNVAPGGALLESALPLPTGVELPLVAVIDGEPCTVPSRVRHSRPVGVDGRSHLIGIEFVSVPPLLATWLAHEFRIGQALGAEA